MIISSPPHTQQTEFWRWIFHLVYFIRSVECPHCEKFTFWYWQLAFPTLFHFSVWLSIHCCFVKNIAFIFIGCFMFQIFTSLYYDHHRRHRHLLLLPNLSPIHFSFLFFIFSFAFFRVEIWVTEFLYWI